MCRLSFQTYAGACWYLALNSPQLQRFQYQRVVMATQCMPSGRLTVVTRRQTLQIWMRLCWAIHAQAQSLAMITCIMRRLVD